MKKWLIILFVFVATSVYAFRISRPQTFSLPWTSDQVNQLNDTLEDLWNLQNGEFNLDIVSTTKGSPDNGDFWLFTGITTTMEFRLDDVTYSLLNNKSDIVFEQDGNGLVYGEIYVKDSVTPTTLNSAAKVQITTFDVNGESNLVTPDHTNDHLTITKAGKYFVAASTSVVNNAAQSHEVVLDIYKNNGATAIDNLHANRNLTGGGGDKGSIALTGIVDLAVNDTLELWADTDSASDRSVTFEDVTLSIIQIGG